MCMAGALILAFVTPRVAGAPDGSASTVTSRPDASSPPVRVGVAAPPADPLLPAPAGPAVPAGLPPTGIDPVALAAPGPRGPNAFVAEFTGDVLAHSPLWRQAQENAGGNGYDFTPMFARIAGLVGRADLGVCHFETPIAPEGEDFTTSPLYGVPPQVIDALKASGFDRCSTASNHSLDRGIAGIERTVDVMAAAGLGQSGMIGSADDVAPHVVTVNGVRVAHLSYTYSYNGLNLPAAETWRSTLLDPDRVIADARTARIAGAQAVILSLHWGIERVSAPTADQRRITERITASGTVDLIVGHHAHVLQPIEQVNGVWVIYGLGNILSNLPANSSWPPESQDAAIATVGFTVRPDGTVAVTRPVITPTWVDKEHGFVIRDVAADLADPGVVGPLRDALQRSMDRTTAVLGPFIATRAFPARASAVAAIAGMAQGQRPPHAA